MDKDKDQLHLTTEEAADRLRHSPYTLIRWRQEGQGHGPKYLKFGRRVLYPVTEIEAFEKRLLRAHTAQQPQG